MPRPILEINRNIESTLTRIENKIYTRLIPLEMTIYKTNEPVAFTERLSGERREVRIGDCWGDLWDCAWFNFRARLPECPQGKDLVLLIDVNGELCLFDADGCPVQGLTNGSSVFDLSLGKPGKRVVRLSAAQIAAQDIDIWADAGCNDLFGTLSEKSVICEAWVAACDEEIRQLYYDFSVLAELMKVLPESSARRAAVMYALNSAALALDMFTPDEVAAARQLLASELAKRGGDASLAVSAIGHAHIDLAWLWPIRETRRKTARTFSTALMLMDKYPDYVFGASQPQQYEWIKNEHPALYGKIKAAVAAGRWEVQGGMWVEPDTNVSGGEALVRQLLYGKQFFMNEFGVDVRSLWLPDVFGYSGALPQLLKKSGIDYFMTIKLSWNEYNRFPHHTFVWKGIDGSSVLAHMPPEGTYNSAAAPLSIHKAESEYLDKGISENCLMVFGIGNGGGGPGEEHLERLRREKGLAGLAPVTQEHSARFFERLEAGRERYAVWQGELYLEKHQGTYTSQSRNKKYNRHMENELVALELMSVLAATNGEFQYPAEEIAAIWKEVLLYQFHDILPGSSIGRVYDESLARYKTMAERVQELQTAAAQALADSCDSRNMIEPVLLVNPLSWPVSEWVEHNGNWRKLDLPPLGYVLADFSCSDELPKAVRGGTDWLENSELRVKFAADGSIVSIFDKRAGRECIAAGARANVLTVYADNGDAWDFSIQYQQAARSEFGLTGSYFRQDGPDACVVQEYTRGKSRIVQQIKLRADGRQLDFVTNADWQEDGRMLRTAFPLNIHANEVQCNIQFGSIARTTRKNTAVDMAMQEICAQKWIDMSQPDYGVAILNDCKYGHTVKDNIIDINLLRSSGYPDARADRGSHEFVYSFYPHAGNHIAGGVMRQGYRLNQGVKKFTPAITARAGVAGGSLLSINCDNVIVEAVKQAEDGNGVIVRLYETHGADAVAVIKFTQKPQTVTLCDLLERPLQLLAADCDEMRLELKPYEILTLRVSR